MDLSVGDEKFIQFSVLPQTEDKVLHFLLSPSFSKDGGVLFFELVFFVRTYHFGTNSSSFPEIFFEDEKDELLDDVIFTSSVTSKISEYNLVLDCGIFFKGDVSLTVSFF